VHLWTIRKPGSVLLALTSGSLFLLLPVWMLISQIYLPCSPGLGNFVFHRSIHDGSGAFPLRLSIKCVWFFEPRLGAGRVFIFQFIAFFGNWESSLTILMKDAGMDMNDDMGFKLGCLLYDL
jgi:hypothetical protein